ncbi:hypothetical protein QJS66_23750 (plasmid) [Kocuria rhizophila]|nr:hypothetical protein QJS66_23750 [Kocuria rhizophila]
MPCISRPHGWRCPGRCRSSTEPSSTLEPAVVFTVFAHWNWPNLVQAGDRPGHRRSQVARGRHRGRRAERAPRWCP